MGAGLAALAWAAQAWAQPGLAPPLAAPAMPFPVPPPAPDPTALMLKPSQWKLLQDTLDQVETHGFEPGEFTPARLQPLLQSEDAAVRAQGGRMMIAGVLRYAHAVKTGRLPEQAFPLDWGLRPAAYDPGPGFIQAANDDTLAAWVASLPPPYPGYESLRQSLIAWRKSVPGNDTPEIAGGKLSADMAGDPRIPLLRRKLAALGYPVGAAPGWDASLTQALMQFQKRHGLSADGVVGPGVLEALNVPVKIRERSIVANLERWRWLPPTLPADRVQVNIAAGILTLFQKDAPVLSMRAVAGKVGDETPMLSSMIHSVVLNPPWNVPGGIAEKELWPKERAHPGYLARAGYVVIKTDGGGRRLQQKAGPTSALGQYKFDFANPYAVYLHDTPSRGAFGRDERLASHGCVRLQNPAVLARTLLEGDPVWTPDAIDARVATNDTTRVPLSRQVAVFLLYWTAFAGADGQANFRADRYGWDEALLKRIDAARPTSA